jgi:hypothetical protein
MIIPQSSRGPLQAVQLLDEVPAVLGPRLPGLRNSELCAVISGYANAHHYHRVSHRALAARPAAVMAG